MKTDTTEKPAPSFGLIALNAVTAATVFAPGGVEAILTKIETEVRSVVTDILTKAGREALGSTAYKVARSKTVLDDMGKELVAEWKKKSGTVDAERRKLRDRLDALKDEVRKPLTDWEDAETQRVGGHDDALARLIAMLAQSGDRSPDEIEAQLAELDMIAQRDWQEFDARAGTTIDHVRAGLRKELVTAQQREADAAELSRLRQLQAERDRQDHEAKIATEAADRARAEAQEEAAAATQRIEQQRQDAERRADQAEADRDVAANAEREKIAAEQATVLAATAKREANKRHAAKINNEAKTGLVACGVDEAAAKAIIGAIVRGEIPHTKISY